jgi:NADP-dependent 3-hydroxy acid dehydrogenase YdfG
LRAIATFDLKGANPSNPYTASRLVYLDVAVLNKKVLRSDTSITVLVNNAGVGAPTRLLDSHVDRLEAMIDLNVTALMRLIYAALPGFLKREVRNHQHRFSGWNCA